MQGGISGSLFVRKNLLEATLELANLKVLTQYWILLKASDVWPIYFNSRGFDI